MVYLQMEVTEKCLSVSEMPSYIHNRKIPDTDKSTREVDCR